MLRTSRELTRYRGLLATLVSRELKARYRGSVLGFFWSLINPALLLSVYSLIFGYVLPARGAEPYAVFLVTGLFPWIWVSSSLLEGSTSLLDNSGLLRKAVFPASVLPSVPVLSNLVHFLLALPVLIAAFVIGRALGHPVGGVTMVLFPLVVALQLPLVAGLALGLAALNVHFKDVRDIVANLLTLLFFLTPVIYPLENVPFKAFWWVVRLNPFTPFTLAYQQIAFFDVVPDATLWLQMIVVSLLGFFLGTALFERLAETLNEAV
jgi:ABC-type polysaccharide/polyol phosphate export permease